uniref:Polyketide synthase n=1 Tax=Peronospora matthiolae TaxID=2874970 RepID=A0AAV1US76_9STRA
MDFSGMKRTWWGIVVVGGRRGVSERVALSVVHASKWDAAASVSRVFSG